MFDGTDLSVAYGGYNDMGSQSSFNNSYQNMQAPPEPPQIPKATASHAIKPEPEYNPPTAMYMQQQPNAKPSSGYAPPSDSIWDRIALKKWEVFKFFVMSLIIVLGLSIDSVLSHYMSSYIGKSFLTENQEMFVRLSYPVGVILLIWMLKASF